MKNTTTKKRGRKPTAAQKAAADAKRKALIDLSGAVKLMMATGQLPVMKVNDALVLIYSERAGVSPNDWSTFQGWKKEGRAVRKGEKAVLIWGQPREMKGKTEIEDPETGQTEEAERKYKRFPVAYLFHRGQTETEAERKARLEMEREKEAARNAQSLAA